MQDPTNEAAHACPWGLCAMRNAYFRVMRFRDVAMRPVTGAFAAVGITPNTLSYAGVGAMIAFALVVHMDVRRAFYLLLFAFLLDLTDGSLARRLHCDGDRGKFTDMLCDTIVFTLFLIGLVRAGLLGAVTGLVLAYTMLLCKILRAIRNALFLETDWFFKSVAGFAPNSIVGLFYLLFVIHATAGFDFFRYAAVPSVAFLVADSIFFYRRILTLNTTRPAPPRMNASA